MGAYILSVWRLGLGEGEDDLGKMGWGYLLAIFDITFIKRTCPDFVANVYPY